MKNKKVYDLALGAMFTALVLVMAFTPLGYLRIGSLAISFITIPVAMGAILLGPWWGAYFGLLFGLTSFAQCFMGDVGGAMLFSISPALTVLTTIAPRVLVGLGSGFIYKILRKGKPEAKLPTVAASLSAPLLNTVLFMTTLLLCFNNTAYVDSLKELYPAANNLIMLAVLMAGVNAVVELIVCGIISFAASSFIQTMLHRKKI